MDFKVPTFFDVEYRKNCAS